MFGEVKEIENNFRKVLEICCNIIPSNFIAFLIEKNKELFHENDLAEKKANQFEKIFASSKVDNLAFKEERVKLEK